MKSRLSALDRELAAMRAEREQQQPKPVPAAEPVVEQAGTMQPAAQTAASQEAVTTESASATPSQSTEQATKEEQAPKIEQSNPVASGAEAKQEAASVAAEQQTTQSAAAPQAQAGESGKEANKLPSEEPATSEITSPSVASAQPPVEIQPVLRKRRVPQHEDVASKPAQSSEDVPQPSSLLPGSVFSYSVKERETVWDIAERFYGDRKYYPVVMELNPHIFLGFTRKKSDVWLYADRREAAALYQRRIEQKDGLLLWNYEVRPGETRRSIYARFFLSRSSDTVFYGDQEVAPGRTIKIILR
jgi:nucleoid-associated protein YgaU